MKWRQNHYSSTIASYRRNFCMPNQNLCLVGTWFIYFIVWHRITTYNITYSHLYILNISCGGTHILCLGFTNRVSHYITILKCIYFIICALFCIQYNIKFKYTYTLYIYIYLSNWKKIYIYTMSQREIEYFPKIRLYNFVKCCNCYVWHF